MYRGKTAKERIIETKGEEYYLQMIERSKEYYRAHKEEVLARKRSRYVSKRADKKAVAAENKEQREKHRAEAKKQGREIGIRTTFKTLGNYGDWTIKTIYGHTINFFANLQVSRNITEEEASSIRKKALARLKSDKRFHNYIVACEPAFNKKGAHFLDVDAYVKVDDEDEYLSLTPYMDFIQASVNELLTPCPTEVD